MKERAIIMIVLFVTTLAVSAQTTEFGYQGHLQASGSPANGSYDLEFALYDAVSGGAQLGPTLSRSSVAVANGNFAVSLDFGSQFSGASRYLEIRVRQTGGGAYTALSPRQPVTSSPYSIRSLNAANADLATNAAQLGGVVSSQYVLTGDTRLSDARPPASGSSNYIQNATTPQASSNFNISGSGAAGGTLSSSIIDAATQYNIGGSRVLSIPGTNNTFTGVEAGSANTTGQANSFFGNGAGKMNAAGSLNAFFGMEAGSSHTNGIKNSFFGFHAGSTTTTGFSNSFFGNSAGANNTTGSTNAFFGDGSGISNTTESNNTMLGTQSDTYAGIANATAIGFRSKVTQSNSLVLGGIMGVNSAPADTNVGIGTTAPTERLHVVGNGLFTGNLTVNGTITGNVPAGSTNYIQNATIQQAGSNFNISGDGTAGGTLSSNIMNATTQFNIGGVRAFGIDAGRNVFAGKEAGTTNATGTENSFFGYSAGILLNSAPHFNGNGNTLIGSYANVAFSDITNATAVGYRSLVGQSNSLVLGHVPGFNEPGPTNSAATKIGIGTIQPQYTLHVIGENVRVENSASFPRFSLNYSAAGVDQKRWQNYASGTGLNFTALNDAENLENAWLQVVRGSGTAISSVRFPNGNVGIGTILNVNNRLDVNGTIGVWTLGGGGTVQLCWNTSSFNLSTCGSSLRYKTNIGRFALGLDLVKRLRPITFDWKDGGMHDVGFAAEDVAAIEPLLVTRNIKGEVEGVKYDRISAVLVNAVREQQVQIDAQKTLIESLAAANRKQQEEIDTLRSLVCAKQRRRSMCRKAK